MKCLQFLYRERESLNLGSKYTINKNKNHSLTLHRDKPFSLKKRIFAILLTGALVLPVFSTFLWLKHQKSLIKKEVKHKIIAGIDKDELVLLKFSQKAIYTELRWEHEAEFKYKGEMYDIVEKEISGDTTYYWCWWDHEETRLNKQLASLLDNILGSDKQSHEKQRQLFTFLKSLYIMELPQWNCHPPVREKKQMAYHKAMYSSYFAPPPTPPPVS